MSILIVAHEQSVLPSLMLTDAPDTKKASSTNRDYLASGPADTRVLKELCLRPARARSNARQSS
jgi:hypothetical protein